MIELIEELTVGDQIFILYDNVDRFLYGNYKVTDTTYVTMNRQSATLKIQSKPKKPRYFKSELTFKGFHINFPNTARTYLVFDDYDSMVRYFCKKLAKDPEINSKVYAKMKRKYPQYFSFTSY